MEVKTEIRNNTQLILPNGPQEKLLQRVSDIRAAALAKKQQARKEEIKFKYDRAFLHLSEKWFMISNPGDLAQDEREALGYLIHKKAMTNLKIRLALTLAGLGGLIFALLIIPFESLAWPLTLVFGLMGCLFSNVSFFHSDVSKFLRNRRLLKKNRWQ